MRFVLAAFVIGAGATALMDVWTVLRRTLLGIQPLSYGLVGRWLAHLPRGRFVHRPISTSPAIRHERAIGWIAHYLIGISFAAVVLALWGLDWACHPTLVPALLVGIGSIAAPFFILQPGMGAGIAASRAANPSSARLQSLITHTIFGFGLYATARAIGLLTPFCETTIVN